ncbi:type I pullulanase, partial [Pseudostreptobacillus sp.]
IEDKQLNYLKKLGVTHVQIMPFYDFSEESVDENNPEERYNWGYDPVNYNIPEGSFATNPENPYVRIKELKEMIKVLHENGIRVIMDVVYNHVFDAMSHSLWKTVQKDAFRFYENGDFSNGSACGNDIASDNPMVRKYIVDSILYWANEFKLDGFRFDLMGILDVDTMNEIREKLDEIDKGIIVLGEGWDLNTNLDKDKKANQLNAYKMPRIAFFSDDMRDTLRGSTFEKLGKGFANGGKSDDRLINSIKGGINLRGYISPDQLIQYVEAHDNNTVFDHFSITNSEDSLVDRKKMQNIATTLVITSQGIPFLHAGQEFFRTKLGHENSYNLSDEINKFDFDRAEKFKENVQYISELIEYRKKNPLFKLNNFDEIEKKFKLLQFNDRSLMYSLDNKIFVLVNSSDKAINFEIEKGNYEIIFSSFKKQNMNILIENLFEVSKYNCVILERK